MDLEEVKPKPLDLDWAKECYMNLSIKQKLKATRGNLMNPLDLANLIEPITSVELDLSLPHDS
jgi:hypothetical protein